MLVTRRHLDRVCLSVVALVGICGTARSAAAATAAEICGNSTWSNCGSAVRMELDRTPGDAKTIVAVAGLWAASYDKQYNWLRSKGRLEKSVPDADKIFEEIKSKVDPLDIVTDKIKDKLIETAVKRYLSRLAPLVVFASSPIVQALKAFFNSSEIASDYDELRLMNDDIQRRLATQLSPYLKPDWKTLLNSAAQQAGPSLRRP
jgi:hypothetical protein